MLKKLNKRPRPRTGWKSPRRGARMFNRYAAFADGGDIKFG
jgi:hypothetical protein